MKILLYIFLLLYSNQVAAQTSINHFPFPGSALGNADGTLLNRLVDRINNIQGNGTPQALQATSLTVTGSTIPTNGLYLPSANVVGISASSTKILTLQKDSGVPGHFEVLAGLNVVGTPASMWEINRNTAAAPPLLGGSMIRLIGNDTANPGISWDSFGRPGFIVFERANNTNASKTALLSGDTIGKISWTGYNGTSYINSDGVGSTVATQFTCQTNENWSTIANGADCYLHVTPAGSTTAAIAWKAFGSTGLSVGSANIGTDPGSGGILATLLNTTSSVTAFNGTPIPAGGTTGTCIKVSSTTNFGICFGSGVPTLSAAKGSLYLRSDGTGTSDRVYVNTNSSTAWTNLVTGG